MSTGSRCWTMLLLFGAMRLWAEAVQVKTIELTPAKVEAPYSYAIQTNRPAHFQELSGPTWLTLDPDKGFLTGTPKQHDLGVSIIEVCSYADEPGKQRCDGLKHILVIRVEPDGCADGKNDDLAWCDDVKRPSEPKRLAFVLDAGCHTENEATEATCIIQFDRLDGEKGNGSTVGRLGTYNQNLYRRIDWSMDSIGSTQGDPLHNATKAAIIRAINGSRVFISGSVLVLKNVDDCSFWSWSVVTQTGTSSNNLYYGPADLTAFCTRNKTALIVLPTHAIWANVYGTLANTNDPTWKPTPEPPAGHECWTGKAVKFPTLPAQGIEPCDKRSDAPPGYKDEKANWFLRRVLYWPPTAWAYNGGTQPGVSQGSISIAPIAGATKSTWDVQTYGSSLLGPGWIGLQGVYEHDRNPKDDLNSFTAALTYDLRIRKEPSWPNLEWKADADSPPFIVVRPLESIVRVGPEWSPDSFKYKSTAATTPAQPTQYLPRQLNIVMGETLRLPIIFSPKLPDIPRQPSQFTVVPVLGVEGGVRVISHQIGLGTICPPSSSSTNHTCASQPQEILRRVAGVDASVRSPYNFTHNFFGDRPLTVDYSYRMRWLYHMEPFANAQYYAFNVPYDAARQSAAEGQSTAGRSYTRITFIQPVSPYFQLRATWQRGALPPAFQFVGNQVTFGLTFANPGSSEH